MDTGERPAENIGSSVDPENNDEKIGTLSQDTEETNGKNIVKSVNIAEESSASLTLPADSKNKPDQEQVPSGTSVQSMDTGKHTYEALPQSGNAGEKNDVAESSSGEKVQSENASAKCDVNLGSPVESKEETADLLEDGEKTKEAANVLDSDPKDKSATSKRIDEDTEEIQSATTVGPTVPSTGTEGIHVKINVTSVNSEKEPGCISVPSEQKADTNDKLPEQAVMPSNPSAQSADTVENTSAVTEQPGNQGEKGDVSESPVDGPKEASISPVEEMKNEADSEFKEKPHIEAESTVDTDKNVHSADKKETYVETSVQTIGTGGNPNVLPVKKEMAAEATNKMPDLGTGLDVDTKEMSGLKCVEHASEATVQSEKASEKCDVNLGSSVKSKEETAALLEEREKTKGAANVPDSDPKDKPAISKRSDEDMEEVKSATPLDPIVPSTDTDGIHGKGNGTSVNPEEVPVSSENSEHSADTSGKLPEEEEIPSNPSADTVENTSAVTERPGNQGDNGDVSKSPVDGPKEAFISPVEEKKTGEADSDFKVKPDLGTGSTVDTEEKKVHSADKEGMHGEISDEITSTGGASNDLPMNEEIHGETTKEDHDLKTESDLRKGSHLVVEEISSEATLHSASKAESYGEASVPTADDGEEAVLSTDPTKDIDKRASLPVDVVKPSENFEGSIDLVQPGHSDGPSVDPVLSRLSTEDMDQPKRSYEDQPKRRKLPSASQSTVSKSLHPASDEKYEADHMEIHSNARTLYSVAAGVLFLAAGLYVYLLWESSPHALPSRSVLQNYQYAFENLKKHFPGQNEALWSRSEKMHLKHLNKSQPLEPATIILTAARDGERTLRCLSEGLAKTYSSALKASYSVIDGSTKGKYESKDAKLQIDQTLSSGFSSTCRAAVLHRLEELPPGSVLILYKYCDHENAAFKNVALVFTVLLEVSTMDLDLPLRELEEKVKDVLWDRYLHTNDINSYDAMDVDKLSGVWSRISHLVLPVVPVESIESGSCPRQVVEP